MLQQSTNPPQIVARPNRATRAAKSALDVIDANIQPIEAVTGNDLLDTLCYMKDENDVSGMLGLYDGFAAIAEVFLHFGNQPRIEGRAAGILEDECAHAWSKAFLVASFLKEVRPNRTQVDFYAETMFKATIRMGGNLAEAVAVAEEIRRWPILPTEFD